MDADSPRHCKHCGFSLDGVSYRKVCPGCGAPVRASLEPDGVPVFGLAQPEPLPMPSGPVLTDQPCLQCAYSLQGLEADGQCPECGMPVMHSLMGRHLRFAGVDYLRALHLGGRLVLWSLVARGLVFGVGFALSIAAPEFAKGAVMILGLIAVGASTYGWVLLTTAHPLVAMSRSRGWARWLTVAANVTEVLAYTSWAGQSPSATGLATTLIPARGCFFTLGFGAIWVLSISIGMVWLSTLARKLPEHPLAALCGMSSWLIPLIVVASAVLTVGCLPFTSFGWLGAYIFYIVVMDRWRGTLRRVRVEAEGRELAAGYIAPG